MRISFYGVLAAAMLLLHSAAAAEQISVTGTDFEEVRSMDLMPDQKADIIVYLKSYGDMVDKYLVTLRSESDFKRVAALLSDQQGRVLFKRVPPGKYRVDVNRMIREDGRLSTVSVGDIMLSVSGMDNFSLGSGK